MAVRQYGSQDYNFGFDDAGAIAIANAIGIKPQTLSVDKEPEFEAEGKNEFAETEAYVRGSPKGTFTLEGYITDLALFKQVIKGEVSGAFTYEAEVYIVKGGKVTVKNTEFTMGEVTGVQFPLVTDAVGTALN